MLMNCVVVAGTVSAALCAQMMEASRLAYLHASQSSKLILMLLAIRDDRAACLLLVNILSARERLKGEILNLKACPWKANLPNICSEAMGTRNGID